MLFVNLETFLKTYLALKNLLVSAHLLFNSQNIQKNICQRLKINRLIRFFTNLFNSNKNHCTMSVKSEKCKTEGDAVCRNA